jgi:non-homologous end joining protein Ku
MDADIVKGFQVEPDAYVTLDPEEVEAIVGNVIVDRMSVERFRPLLCVVTIFWLVCH